MDQLPTREDLLANQLALADLVHRAAASSRQQGWSAGQIAAHLILNNGLFVCTARDVVETGSAVYDNEHAVDDEATAALAAGSGAPGVLAEWLRQSATAYVDLLTTLSAEVLDTTITATIRSDDQTILDAEPRRLGDLMVGQLTFHAAMHVEQARDVLAD